jgi:hypothetical protein
MWHTKISKKHIIFSIFRTYSRLWEVIISRYLCIRKCFFMVAISQWYSHPEIDDVFRRNYDEKTWNSVHVLHFVKKIFRNYTMCHLRTLGGMWNSCIFLWKKSLKNMINFYFNMLTLQKDISIFWFAVIEYFSVSETVVKNHVRVSLIGDVH